MKVVCFLLVSCLLVLYVRASGELRTVTAAGFQQCPNNTKCAVAGDMCCCTTQGVCLTSNIGYECFNTREYECCPSIGPHPTMCKTPQVCVTDHKSASGYICALPPNPTQGPTRPNPTGVPTVKPTCSKYTGCDTCTGVDGCDWCPSNSKCITSGQILECPSVVVLTPNACPKTETPHVNYSTARNNGVLAAFVVLFVLQAAIGGIIYIQLKKKIDPIAFTHASRSDITDFSGIPHGEDITEIIKNDCPQGPIWADVSLKVPTLHAMIPMGVANIFGIILAAVAPMPVLSIVFLIIMIPGFVYIIRGLHQMCGNHHYTNVYWLTSDGAVIRTNGWHGPNNNFFAYSEMKNVHYKTSEFGTGNVYFAESWPKVVKVEENSEEKPDDENASQEGGKLTDDVESQKDDVSCLQTKKKIGFENITKCKEIYDIIQSKITDNNLTQTPTFSNSYVQFSAKLGDF